MDSNWRSLGALIGFMLAVVFGVIGVALINISRDFVKVEALLINGYSVASENGYRVTRLVEYLVGEKVYVGKTTSEQEYDIDTAETLAASKINERVYVYYERSNPRNVKVESEETELRLGYVYFGFALVLGWGAFVLYTS